jgi:DNA-binding MarR family transcriptional regulator
VLDEAVADYLGIHRTDARCLDILDREGPLTAGRLAERARISPGAMTSLLDRLERKGLARRKRDTADRRRVLVEVTPKLTSLAQELYGTHEEAGRRLEVFSDEQLELLVRFLHGSIAWQEGRLERLAELRSRRTASD